MFLFFDDVILALCCRWGLRIVHCPGDVVQNWKYGCSGKKHSCVFVASVYCLSVWPTSALWQSGQVNL